MAKKRKKKNYRLRKSVRRTLGALFMISAIIIAAIPFPDAAATDGTQLLDDGSGEPSIEYRVADDELDDIKQLEGVKLQPGADEETPMAYVLVKDGEDSYNYKWQYKYFLNDNGDAIITEYNSGYTVEDVTLDKVNSNSYVEIKEEGVGGFAEYFANETIVYNYTYDDWAASVQGDVDILKYYYKKTYDDFVIACENYKKSPDTVQKPEALAVSLKDISTLDLRKEYFLEYISETIDGIQWKFDKNKFELKDVLKPIANQSASEVYYIVKLKNPKADVGIAKFYKDSNGFLYKGTESTDIIGIGQNAEGKGAFEGVNTYLTLTLPQNIQYIADRAFMKSNIKEITINSVQVIGNQAFKDSLLEKINWGIVGTQKIGAEAFRGTQLKNITIPWTVNEVGAGAFSYNKNLTSIDIADNSQGVIVGKYAFFECEMLNSVDWTDENVTFIGEGAFAMLGGPKGNFTEFKFPRNISSEDDLGKYILAGRTNLKYVVMPELLGYRTSAKLAKYIFYECSDLECVEFPAESTYCGYVTFDSDTFKSVRNSEFYVKGPKLASDNSIAGPRKSTWACTMNDGSPVPYMYEENGKSFYEVCQDEYLLSIDDKGILQRCNFVIKNGDDFEVTDKPATAAKRLIVPGTVGKLPIKGIAEGCFTDTFLKNIQGPLVIKDGGALKEIDANVFAGAAFTHVYLGDSVEKVGSNAFAGCNSLVQVTFGKNIKEIGDSAFENCMLLTDIYFREPDNHSTLSSIGNKAFSTGSPRLVIKGAISPEYLPYSWAMDSGNYVDAREGVRVCYKTPAPTAENVLEDNYLIFTAPKDEFDVNGISGVKSIPTNLTVILDNTNNLPTLVDYQHYSDIDETIRTAYENNDSENINDAERKLCETALDIKVPEGVKSIDAKKYFDSIESGDNSENWFAYFTEDREDGSSTKDLYDDFGLFAGFYGDETDEEGKKCEFPLGATDHQGELEEAESKGNDRIESILLPSVEYLPDGVFDNCENLQTIQIGDDIKELGALPFSNCTSLSSVSFGNDKFKCDNGIVYETLDDNSQKLVECLASRGKIVGSSTINLKNDSTLANVSEIADGAFKDCKNITSFDLTDVSGIKKIPNECFENSVMLNKVILPPAVTRIGDEAFATGGSYLQVTVKGKEVSLGNNAFGTIADGNRVTYPYLISYEDSAVRSDAKDQGADITETLDKLYEFCFYDETGLELLKVDYVEHGGTAQPPKDEDIPKLSGKKFVGWNKSLENITKDDFTLAVYESTGSDDGDDNSGGGSGDGSGNNGGGSGNNGGGTNVNGGVDTDGDGKPDTDADGNKLYKLTVTNGEGSGYYAAGKTVTIKAGNAPKGSTFANWSCSNQDLIFEDPTKWITTITMIRSDVTVIANFTGQYVLEVEYGSGSGSYPAGAKVAISAVDAPQGRKFASWVTKTNGLNIENSRKESTVITMPASNAKITATYMDTGSISGNSTSSKNNTSVVITKPGISDKDTASAYVSGSTDNFVVKITESLEAADEVQNALQKKYPDMSRIKYFAMDISLYDAKGINKITDTDGLKVNITMPIPDALREYAGNNRVGAVVNGELETLNPKFTTINGVPSVSFTATHFSPYTIYVDTGNMTVSAGTLDSTPKTGDGIHPKWFLSIGLACISIILFTKKDRRYVKAYR